MDRVAAPHQGAVTATVHSRKLRFFLVQQRFGEPGLLFPVVIIVTLYLYVY
jgi:hypothetical protein